MTLSEVAKRTDLTRATAPRVSDDAGRAGLRPHGLVKFLSDTDGAAARLRIPVRPESAAAGPAAPAGSLGKALPVSYTHLRAHETDSYLVCRLLLEKKKKTILHIKQK